MKIVWGGQRFQIFEANKWGNFSRVALKTRVYDFQSYEGNILLANQEKAILSTEHFMFKFSFFPWRVKWGERILMNILLVEKKREGGKPPFLRHI